MRGSAWPQKVRFVGKAKKGSTNEHLNKRKAYAASGTRFRIQAMRSKTRDTRCLSHLAQAAKTLTRMMTISSSPRCRAGRSVTKSSKEHAKSKNDHKRGKSEPAQTESEKDSDMDFFSDIRQFVTPECNRDSAPSHAVVCELEGSSSIQIESTTSPRQPPTSVNLMIKQQFETRFPQASPEVILQVFSSSESVSEAIDKLLQLNSRSPSLNDQPQENHHNIFLHVGERSSSGSGTS
ncbi:hypothetical protein OS493_000652 [Desmophyllum pertusum]|uniref:Uncharacterized protein n=1 Tax=Desmophyllum pertusum TaxID=174260 RepID=A0A9X0A7F4_9CNID|nr:hypothetical protein OS493_000652 [Desmophyllum pertusum]